MIFVRSNNVSRPVVASASFRARGGNTLREASSGRTEDVVGIQSIASSSSPSRKRISALHDRGASGAEGASDVAGGDDAEGGRGIGGGWKEAGLSEGWPKTGPAACQVRSGIGAEERERLSSGKGVSRARGCVVVVGVVVVVTCGGGDHEARKEVPVLGVLARDAEESIRRTAGAR